MAIIPPVHSDEEIEKIADAVRGELQDNPCYLDYDPTTKEFTRIYFSNPDLYRACIAGWYIIEKLKHDQINFISRNKSITVADGEKGMGQ